MTKWTFDGSKIVKGKVVNKEVNGKSDCSSCTDKQVSSESTSKSQCPHVGCPAMDGPVPDVPTEAQKGTTMSSVKASSMMSAGMDATKAADATKDYKVENDQLFCRHNHDIFTYKRYQCPSWLKPIHVRRKPSGYVRVPPEVPINTPVWDCASIDDTDYINFQKDRRGVTAIVMLKIVAYTNNHVYVLSDDKQISSRKMMIYLP